MVNRTGRILSILDPHALAPTRFVISVSGYYICIVILFENLCNSIRGLPTTVLQATIAGASITAVIMSWTRRHPKDATRHLIDVDVLLLLTPPMLVGVMFGIIFHTACPQWFVFVMMILLVSWATYKTATKVGHNKTIKQDTNASGISMIDVLCTFLNEFRH